MFQPPLWLKISGSAIALAVAVAVLAWWFIQDASHEAIVTHEENDLKDDARVRGALILQWTDRFRADVQSLAADPDVIAAVGHAAGARNTLEGKFGQVNDAAEAFCKSRSEVNRFQYSRLSLTRRDGEIVEQYPPAGGTAADPHPVASKLAGMPSPPRRPLVTIHEEVVHAAMPLADGEHLLVLSVKLQDLKDIALNMSRGISVLTDREGGILAEPREHRFQFPAGPKVLPSLFPEPADDDEQEDQPGDARKVHDFYDPAGGDGDRTGDELVNVRIDDELNHDGRFGELHTLSRYFDDGDIEPETLKELITELTEADFGDGHIRCFPRPEEVKLPTRFLVSADSTETIDEVRSWLDEKGVSGTDVTESSPTHLCLIKLYFDPDNQPDQFLALATFGSEEEFQADSKHLMKEATLLVVLFGGLLAVILGVVTALVIADPLRTIRRAARKIGEGDYSAVELPRSNTREIVSLREAIETMIGRVRHREARLAAVLNNAAEGVVITDATGRIESLNFAAEKIFQYDLEQVQGHDFRELIPASSGDKSSGDEEEDSSLTDLGNSDQRSKHVELTGRRKDGTEVPLELAAEVAEVGDEVIYVYVLRDITERKKAEAEHRRLTEELRDERDKLDERVQSRTQQLQQASLARDLFLASVSHELRQPLTAVIGYCDMLMKKNKEDPSITLLAGKIRGHGSHQLSIINDILDYQKIIMGRADVELTTFDLVDVLQESGDAFRDRAKKQGNRLTVECPEDMPTMKADRRRVRQIVDNLLGNACKFTQNGLISVRVRPGWDTVRIEVADTGRGIPKSKQGEIFRPLSKILDRKDNPEGTGLGLAICQQLAELMGGKVSFESVEGEGTTFRVELPLEVKPPDPSGSGVLAKSGTHAALTGTEPEPESGSEPNEDNRRVLVIDDDPAVCDIMTQMLEDDGFEIHAAPSGARGVELAKQLRPCVITLDVIMPDMDGWETLAKLKQDPATADIPVVMMTMLEAERKGFALGATEFVHKPVQDWDRLAETLRTSCHGGADVLVIDDDEELGERVCAALRGSDGLCVRRVSDAEAARAALAERVPSAILVNLLTPGLGGPMFLRELQGDARLAEVPLVVLTSERLSDSEREYLNDRVLQVVREGVSADELTGLILKSVRPKN